MPDAPDIVLCSKLCRHNPTDPTQKDTTLTIRCLDHGLSQMCPFSYPWYLFFKKYVIDMHKLYSVDRKQKNIIREISHVSW